MAAGAYVNVGCCRTAHRGLDTLLQSPGVQPHVLRTPTPPWAFDTEVDGPGNGMTGIVTERTVPSGEALSVPRKTKRVRVQLDTRIELTNEELKVFHLLCHI
jgi:hypothetical protein